MELSSLVATYCPNRGRHSKHYDPKWRELRRKKVLKVYFHCFLVYYMWYDSISYLNIVYCHIILIVSLNALSCHQ